MTFSDKEMKELGLGQVLCRGLDSTLKFEATLIFPRQIENPLMSADARADRLTMYCVPKATPVNGECKPYVLKARRILVKLWLCPLLVYEQDKAAS